MVSFSKTSQQPIPFLYSGQNHSKFIILSFVNFTGTWCLFRDRMLASALNFAIGFFGYPFDGQYQQLITIEHDGVRFIRLGN